jgi:hypothetical protein
MVVGNGAAASVDNTAKGMSNGQFTFWRESGAGIGTQTTVALNPANGRACLDACQSDVNCAGVVIAGAFTNLDTTGITSCTLIKGTATLGLPQRTLTRADTAKFSMPVGLSGV